MKNVSIKDLIIEKRRKLREKGFTDEEINLMLKRESCQSVTDLISEIKLLEKLYKEDLGG